MDVISIDINDGDLPFLPTPGDSNLASIPLRRRAFTEPIEAGNNSILCTGFMGILLLREGTDKNTQPVLFNPAVTGAVNSAEENNGLSGIKADANRAWGIDIKNLCDWSSAEQTEFGLSAADEIVDLYIGFFRIDTASFKIHADPTNHVLLKINTNPTDGLTIHRVTFDIQPGDVLKEVDEGWYLDNAGEEELLGPNVMTHVAKDEYLALTLPYGSYNSLILTKHPSLGSGEIGDAVDNAKLSLANFPTGFGTSMLSFSIMGQKDVSKFEIGNLLVRHDE